MRGEKTVPSGAIRPGSPPRARGKVLPSLRPDFPMGSPPRARGKDRSIRSDEHPPGITPACAGKSAPRRSVLISPWDHPRVRGEKSLVLSCMVRRLGSPPRARGKDRSIRSDEHPPGITPACAGKRRRPQRWWAFGRDHPRVRGEKSPPLVSCFATWGSPPRARGKDGTHHQRRMEGGITPACAGKRKSQGFF